MDYQEIYTEIIVKLKKHERPLVKLTPELAAVLKNEWQRIIHEAPVNHGALKKILCILDNTQNMSSEFTELFIITLEKIRDQELLIYTLAASQKHVVEESLRSGNMISSDYFIKLKELLKSQDPEVLEWTLRTIDSMGPLSLRFVNDVRKVNLGIAKFFNQHHKSSAQIIKLMEMQWEKMRL